MTNWRVSSKTKFAYDLWPKFHLCVLLFIVLLMLKWIRTIWFNFILFLFSTSLTSENKNRNDLQWRVEFLRKIEERQMVHFKDNDVFYYYYGAHHLHWEYLCYSLCTIFEDFWCNVVEIIKESSLVNCSLNSFALSFDSSVTRFHISFLLRIELSSVVLKFFTIHLLYFLSNIRLFFLFLTVFSAFFILDPIPIIISQTNFYIFSITAERAVCMSHIKRQDPNKQK